jgi:hypothetical protein
VVFVGVSAVAIALRLSWARGAWFTGDDWDLLANRTVGDAGDLFRPHFGHWITLMVIAYRFLWQIFGLRYLPYELFQIALYLGSAVMTRVVLRRVGVSPWVATVVASVVLFTAADTNVFFTCVLVLGMTQLLLADHDGPVDRRDYLGLLAGFAALMCSAVAITMTVAVGLSVLLRRRWRVALFHTLPLAVAYLCWTHLSPRGWGNESNGAAGVGEVVRFVVIGVHTASDRVSQLPGLGVLVIAVLAIGSVCAVADIGVARVRRVLAIPLGMFGGALWFLVLTGTVRAGVHSSKFGVVRSEGPQLGAEGRYVYVVISLVAPLFAVAVDAVLRRWRNLLPAFLVVVVACTPAYLLQFRADARLQRYSETGRYQVASATDKQQILAAPRVPFANQLPRDLPVEVLPRFGVLGGTVPLGWLVDATASGRVPSPDHLTPQDQATLTLQLALAPSDGASTSRCTRIQGPTTKVLDKGQVMTVRDGDVSVVYESSPTESRPRRLHPGTFAALAGPLKVRLTPVQSAEAAPTVCL